MKLFIRKVVFLVELTLFVIVAHSQTVTSARNGVWTDPSTWIGGIVPSSANAAQIVIDHEIELIAGSPISASNLVVNNELILGSGSQLTILPDTHLSVFDFQIKGTLVARENAVLLGTSVANTLFDEGSSYVHDQGPLGFIPLAKWDKESTFRIIGFTDSGYINIAHRDGWQQLFGNVVYDCPDQTVFVVDLNGYLGRIQGDFTISNTNNQTLRLSATRNFALDVAGDLNILGPSEVWFSTNASADIRIHGDMRYLSSSTGPSYLTTRGTVNITVDGGLDVNSAGAVRMMSSVVDSIGTRSATINVGGDLSMTRGALISAGGDAGNGRLIFNGNAVQYVNIASIGMNIQGRIDYVVESGATIDLGTSVLKNEAGDFQVKGKICLGSPDPLGAIQIGVGGNIGIAGLHIFDDGASIEYNGTVPQWVGNGHPQNVSVDLISNNSTVVTANQDIVVGGSLEIRAGHFDSKEFDVSIWKDLIISESASVDVSNVTMSGDMNQDISANGNVLENITVLKAANSSVILSSPLELRGILSIISPFTMVHSAGFLTIASDTDGDAPGGMIATLPQGAGISGNITVQRFMSGEGRIYRYIAAPVSGASVSQLMDDFPVTGTFVDPSIGAGIASGNPSFFYYNESRGGLQDGWIPYPSQGLALNNALDVGKGYAAFIRKGTSATVWDLTGTLNQGDISLPVAFTANNQPSNGWNLVGNPYACPIDWDVGWRRTNISNVVSIRDNGVPGSTFRYWDGDVNYSDIPGGVIAIGQAFWVRATGPHPYLIVSEQAKVPLPASFFRKRPEEIHSFCLTIEGKDLSDRLYFKVRHTATDSLDEWDAIKMANEHLNFFTMVEGVKVAVNARRTSPCGKEVIQLFTEGLVPGDYTLGLTVKNGMKGYSYFLYDRFEGNKVLFEEGRSLEVGVTTDPRSQASDRFELWLEEHQLKTDVSVISPDSFCDGDRMRVTLKGSYPGIYYSVWNQDKQVSNDLMASQAMLDIDVASDSLAIGLNVLTVKASSMCGSRALDRVIRVSRLQVMPLMVDSAKVCVGQSATLRASSADGTMRFAWFNDRTSTDTLSNRPNWTTAPVEKSTKYFVCGTTTSGCSTPRQSVVVEAVQAIPLQITVEDHDRLLSNYREGNRWSLNGVPLASTANFIDIEDGGVYGLKVDSAGCVQEDSFEYIVLGLESPRHRLAVYPNPVQNQVAFSTTLEGIAQVEIMNSQGSVVWKGRTYLESSETNRLNIDFLKDGVYFARVICKTVERVVRFIKQVPK